jgi:hypothetical protein
MFGIIGTIAVIVQMAALSWGIDTRLVLLIALFACTAWIFHAINNRDKWLFITNTVVAAFAIWGIA